MIFSLIADGSANEMPTGALVALIICGVVILAFAIFGTVLRSRDMSKKNKRAKKKSKHATTSASAVVEEKKDYDFTNLTEEEKNLIRKHRDQAK